MPDCRLKASILGYLGYLGLVERIIETAPTSEGEGCLDRWTVISSAIELKNNYYEANMTSATHADIREIKTAIEAIARGAEVRAELSNVT